MDKLLTFQTSTEKGIFLYTVGEGRDKGYLEKTASTNFHPLISDYIARAKKIPGKTQLLLTALGALEYWGSNVNGDGFPEASLKNDTEQFGYKTFELYAKAFKHHVNKADSKSYGNVALSVWNDRMKRVELIVVLDEASAPDIVERIDKGEYPQVSMGCLRPNAEILLSDFRKRKVCELVAGDEIIDGEGRVSKVSYPHKHFHNGQWVHVDVFGIHHAEPTTEEHPWLILNQEQLACRGNASNKSRKQTRCTPNSKHKKGCTDCHFKDLLSLKPSWVRADELRVGDYVGTPIPKMFSEYNEDTMFSSLLGLYLAEGHITSDNYAQFTVNINEVDKIMDHFQGHYIFKQSDHPESENAKKLTIYDKSVSEKLVSYAGKGAHNKLLSPEVMGWDRENQLKLLGQYLNGDGGVYNGSVYFSTCNKDLADQIQLLLLRNDIISSLNVNVHKPSIIVNKETVEYQIWCGVNTSHILSPYTWKEGFRDSENFIDKRFIAEGYLWSPIINIEKEECNEEVFNIAIESGCYDRDSYVVNGIALHNCKVPYDVCSICSNKAKTRAEYCDHLRYHMNKIPPGYTKKAYAINTLPRFFDISFVLIGADRIAAVMKKVASAHPQFGISSAEIAESQNVIHNPALTSIKTGFEKVAFGLTKEKVAARKMAEIEKEVPANIEPNLVKKIEELGNSGSEALIPLEPKLPKEVIIRISSGPTGMGLVNKIMSTLSILGIVPKKEEFQDMVLRAMGRSDLAEDYERRGLLFDPSTPLTPAQRCACDKHLDLNHRHFDGNIFEALKPHMEDRSYSRPLLERRIIRLVKLAEEGKLEYPNTERAKTAEDQRKPIGAFTMMLTLTGLYAALGEKAPELAKVGLDKVLGKHPGLSLAVGLGALAGFNQLSKRNVMGKYDFNPAQGQTFDPNMSWQDNIMRKNDTPLTKTASVATRLFLGVPAIYMASGMKTIDKARDPYKKESAIGSFIRKNPDIASALFVGEAMAGRPISGKISKGLSLLRKTASIGEDLKSTAVFSLAFPGSSLPLRFATAAVDQGIIAGVEKLLSKKGKNSQGGANA